MKRFNFVLAILFFLSCQESEKEPISASIFGAGVISSEAPEFATTVNKEQTRVYFNRTTADRSVMKIMVSTLKEGVWTDAEALPFSKGEYLDVDPFLSFDESRLYFSSDRPVDTLTTGGEILNTWYVEKTGDSWSEPINAGYPLNSDSTEIFVTMAKNGNAYFVSERSGERTIMVSRFENGKYQEAEKIDLKLRGESVYASNPCIASDESFIIVACRDPEGNGAPDLFVSRNTNGNWSPMVNLGEAVNSPFADFAPGLSKDDQILYFSSERPGIVGKQAEGVRPPGDIYKVDIHRVLESLEE